MGITVIGGANIDILGFSQAKMLMGDSNPGRVTLTPGGVGRNIAQALAACSQGTKINLITILSDDANSRLVKEMTEETGVSMESSIFLSGYSCPTYLAVMDGGDMVTAVNDMALMEKLTPILLKDRVKTIDEADMVILDANLPGNTIAWLTSSFPHIRFFAETVSAAKCRRFLGCLGTLYGIKPNRLEAETLTGIKIINQDDARRAASQLRIWGVKNVIITLGSLGSVYASENDEGYIPSQESSLLNSNGFNTNGAGDFFLAGVVTSLIEGESLKVSCQRGTIKAIRKIGGEKYNGCNC